MDKNLFIGLEYEIRQLERYRDSKESEFPTLSRLLSKDDYNRYVLMDANMKQNFSTMHNASRIHILEQSV